jgi:hypothetical protein
MSKIEGDSIDMALIKNSASQLQTQENDIHRALKAWYLTPGLQRDLRNKENDAVQTVLEVLDRRRATGRGRLEGKVGNRAVSPQL